MAHQAFVIATWLSLSAGAALPVYAQDVADCPGLTFGKGRRAICLPQGEVSFADDVVSFAPGARPSSGVFADPAHALGRPDYTNNNSPGFLSLGCDGVLVVRFTDNALVDVDGPDLYVFEVGPAVEATVLAISEDGRRWVDVGRIEGSRADVDIAPFVTPRQTFPYVRLTNASRTCGGRHSGADIDAIAAVGSALRLSLDGAVLFDTGQSTLKPTARAAIDALLPRIRGYGAGARVDVEGHTDDVGDATSNQALSEARAAAVATYLATALGVPADQVGRVGHGETRPVAPNDGEAGRARNRRVDILVRPER